MLSSEPLVSVIIPTNNSASVIGEALDSVNNQTYDNVELIIVDNESKDYTLDICRKYECKIINIRDASPSEARLLGAHESNGEYLLFIDDDHLLPHGLIEECLDEIDEYAGLVIPERPRFTNDSLKLAISYERKIMEEIGRGLPRFFQRSEYFKRGGHDPSLHYGEDWALKNKMKERQTKLGGSIIYHKEPESFQEIFRKYLAYGKSLKSANPGYGIFTEKLIPFISELGKLTSKSPKIGINVTLLKLIKSTALLLGLLSSGES